ncbi:MAG: hypothetical protein L7S48_01500, partial [Candidatus Poseidonia sp.]|nr:hypothetical protein [Poseidonia sp.]
MNISGSPLVLRRFQIDETGTSGANVWIEARQSGIINFLLTIVGLDPNSSLKVTRGSISFRNSSVFGSSQVSTPLANIGAFVGGYKKPFLALVSAVLFFLTGFASLAAAGDDGGIMIFFFFAFLSLVCLIYYYLRKTMFMGFETSGGGTYGFAFQASVLEGVGVDIKRVESTIAYVNSLISSASLGEKFVEQSQTQVLGGRTATMLDSTPSQLPVQALAPQPVVQAAVTPAPQPAPAPVVQAAATPVPQPAPAPVVQAAATPVPQ